MNLLMSIYLGCSQPEPVGETIVLPVPSFSLLPNVPSTRDDIYLNIAPVVIASTDLEVQWFTKWTSQTQMINGPVLSSTATTTDESWTVEVWYTAGEQESTHITHSFDIVGSSSDLELKITPIFPRSNEDIEANIVVFDADREILSVEYNWTINGEPLGIQDRILTSEQVDKGDEIILTINSLNGEVLTQSPILEFTIRNTVPILEGAALSPLEPNGYDILNVTEDFSDYDGDNLTYEYRWFLNGLRLDGIATPTLPLVDFARGNFFHVEVRGFDGEEYTEWVSSQPVTLVNTPPTLTSLTINETSPRSDQMVSCGYESFVDFDSDLNQTEIVWVRGAQQVGTGPFLDLDSIDAFPRERIFCVATANDGFEDGNTLFDQLIVENTPPVVYLAQLAPDPAYVTEQLACSPQIVYDIDGSTNFDYNYQWYINGYSANLDIPGMTEDPPYLNSSMMRSDPNNSSLEIPAFKKGDTVVCAVQADDRSPHRTGQGNFTLSNGVQIINTAPTATGVYLDPADPSVEDIVSCVIDEYYDPDVDDDNLSTFAWYKNGQFAQNGADINLFSFNATLNDTFTCEVQLFDGESYGSTYSISIQAINQPPVVSFVELNPATPTSQDSIVATALFSDTDGDLVTVEYIWTINGVAQNESSNSLSGPFTPGDLIGVEVTPFDGVEFGNPYTTPTVEVINTAPQSPIVELSEVTGGYQCATTQTPFDIDGDPVQVTVDWICDGQALSAHSNYAQFSGQIGQIEYAMDFIPTALLSNCFLWQCSIDVSDGQLSSGSVVSNLVIP